MKARAFWLGCMGTLLVASCVAPTATTPEGASETARRTSTAGAKKTGTPAPGATPGEDGGGDIVGNVTPDPNVTPTGATPTPTATSTPAGTQATFFAKVVDGSGQVVSGADVEGFAGDATGFVAALKTAKSDADGLFEMKADGNAPLNIEVSKDGKKALKFNIAGTSSNNTFTLAATGTITGKVAAAGVSDLASVEVVIPGTDYKATTNASGDFTLSDVPVGTYSLKATRASLGTANLADVQVQAGQTRANTNFTFTTSVPTLSTLSPLNGGKGVDVTLTGTKFGTDSSKVEVTFAGVAATVSSVTDTQIVAKVPTGAVNGNVVVKVNEIASNGKAFQAIAYLLFEVDKRTLYVGDAFTYTVQARDTEDALIASPTITEWQKDGTAFTVTPAGDKRTALVTATNGGTGSLRVLSGTEMEEIPIVVDATTITVSTLAGNGTTGDTASTLLGPTGIAGDGTTFYICDQNESNPSGGTKGSRIRRLTSTGTLSSYAGASTHGFADHVNDPAQARFHFPRNAVLDGNDLYVADTMNNRIRKLNVSTGAVTTVAGVTQAFSFPDTMPASNDGNNQLCFPAGVTLDASKNVYFTEWHYNAPAGASGRTTSKIRRIAAADGALTTLNLMGPNSVLANPTGLVAASGGLLYVCDTYHNLIKRINIATGTVTKVIGAQGQDGTGLPGYLDGPGDIAQIQTPDGLAIDGQGRLYCTDGLGYVREITFDGEDVATVRTIAGSGAPGDGFSGDFHADGTGSAARFQLPAGIWVNAAGSEVYVADYQNKRVRKIVINRPS